MAAQATETEDAAPLQLTNGYKLIAEANIFNKRIQRPRDDQMWAPMALSGGLLLMRSQDELRCIDMRAKEDAGSK